MDARTAQARKMMHQAALSIKNIEENSGILQMDELQVSLFVLQNAINLLTNKINLAIIIRDEAGDESTNDYMCSQESKQIISNGGFSEI